MKPASRDDSIVEMACPDEQAIVDFVEHRLASEERACVDAHLDECTRCQAAAAELVTVPRRHHAAAHIEPEPRDAFGERYRVLHVLGSGAMGVVYAAFDRVLERRVAVKVLRRPRARRNGSAHGGTGAGSARGLREARALARLSHPNIVDVFDVGWCTQGLFIAMELVEGRTLRQWWDDAPRRWSEVVTLMRDAAAALAAAHAQGIVHRDFKPDNVMVSQGRLKVLDFGLARRGDDTVATMPSSTEQSVEDRLTRTGFIVGTPAYLAPEGHESGRADPRSDQYAFFVTLFEAMCGTRPFVGASLNELELLKRRGLADDVAWPSDVPRWLRAVVVRGLAPDPAHRFASMDEVGRLLRRGQTRRRRAVVLGSVATAALALSFLVPEASTPCERTADALGEVWNDERRATISQSLRARAPAREPGLVGALDDYAEQWTASYVELCAATSGKPRVSEAWATCLLARRAAIDELAALLVDPEVDLSNTDVSEQSLPPIAACTAADADADASPAELEELLARARVLEKTGRYDDLLALTVVVVERARAAGVPRVEANALIRRGLAMRHLARFDDAERAFTDAYMVALRNQLDVVAADAALFLAQSATFDRARVDDGLAWARHAEAALVRAGEDPELHPELQYTLGEMRWAKGRAEEALPYYERALALSDTDGTRAVRSLSLANLLSSLQRGDEAVPHYERAIELLTKTHTASHPDTITARLHFSQSRLMVGDLQKALALVDEAAEHMANAQAPAHLRAYERVRRAAVLQALGDLPGAVAAQLEGVALTEETVGHGHPVVAAHRRTLAAMQRAAGDCEAALEQALHARTIVEASATQQPPHYAKMRWEQAAALRCLGRDAEAQREEAAAIEILAAADPSAPELAQWRGETR